MNEKEYILFYTNRIAKELEKIKNIVNNVENSELSEIDEKKIMAICLNIENISTGINNRTYSYYCKK